MTRNKGVRKSGDPKRAVLDKAIVVLATGAFLYIASAIFAGSPMLAAVARGARLAAPWALFVGGLLLLLYFVLVRSSLPKIEGKGESIDFGQSTSLLREPTIAPQPIAYEGEYWRPTCASCGVKMVERTARGKGDKFWGCAQYPKCRSTLQMR